MNEDDERKLLDSITFEQLILWRPDLVRRIEEEYSAMVLWTPDDLPDGVSDEIDGLKRSWREAQGE
jgi:hypothetical protein